MSSQSIKVPPEKIAIVTDGSRGLGRSTVLSLAEHGISSILTYNSNRAEADKVVAAVTASGATAIALQLNTADAQLTASPTH